MPELTVASAETCLLHRVSFVEQSIFPEMPKRQAFLASGGV
jgi:hypothetical protein